MAIDNTVITTIARELNLSQHHVANCLNLHQEGSTVPFITRYRKEMTGEMDESIVRAVIDRFTYLENLAKRKQDILASIEEQGKLTPEVQQAIVSCEKMVELEDLYLPYKQKRKTRASVARDRGLEPLALAILAGGNVDPTAFINPENELPDSEAVLAGTMDIIAEMVAEEPLVRNTVRRELQHNGIIECRKRRIAPDDSPYTMYYEYEEKLGDMPPHRTLAINRAEREDAIRIKLLYDREQLETMIGRIVAEKYPQHHPTYVELAISDGLKRLVVPSIETELRNMKTEEAEAHAVAVFGENLRHLLLTPPIQVGNILGLDPAYRTGCKVVVVSVQGDLLANTTVYPVPPHNDVVKASAVICELVRKHQVKLIAIGNGTASAETEEFISELITKALPDVKYMIVNEAGASVYSVSEVAREEFPEHDATVRGAVSIARRVLDPLAELVKIDPKSIGVGQYQHDLTQSFLSTKLQDVVESVVNYVGVNLNTASASLLQFVSGVNSAIARNIVTYRRQIGGFSSRDELLAVPKIGKVTFEQCAGFLRVPEGKNLLDNTSVHPESYAVALQLLERAQHDAGKLKALVSKTKGGIEKLAEELGCGVPTLRDIVDQLDRPGRDPRSDLEKPILRSSKVSLEDMQEGMILEGVVRNVVDFGAFVDVGLKNDGLVHVSELAERFVKNPHDVIAVGARVKVKILGIDRERKRLALSIKQAL